MNLLYHWPWPTMSNFIRRKYNFVNHPISKKSRPNCFRRKICVPKTSVYLILVCDMVATRLRRWNLVSDGNKIPIRNYFFSLSRILWPGHSERWSGGRGKHRKKNAYNEKKIEIWVKCWSSFQQWTTVLHCNIPARKNPTYMKVWHDPWVIRLICQRYSCNLFNMGLLSKIHLSQA